MACLDPDGTPAGLHFLCPHRLDPPNPARRAEKVALALLFWFYAFSVWASPAQPNPWSILFFLRPTRPVQNRKTNSSSFFSFLPSSHLFAVSTARHPIVHLCVYLLNCNSNASMLHTLLWNWWCMHEKTDWMHAWQICHDSASAAVCVWVCDRVHDICVYVCMYVCVFVYFIIVFMNLHIYKHACVHARMDRIVP